MNRALVALDATPFRVETLLSTHPG